MKLFKVLVTLFVLGNVAYPADPPSTHGMLFFGKAKTYISHLPMFHKPHDYQWIAEIELPEAIKQVYLNSPDGLHTLVPQPFVLPQVAEGQLPFFATLFQGHFERGGTPITRLFKVKIVKNIVFKKFDPSAVASNGFEGYAFGNETENFIAHSIVKAPDFDQVVQVDVPSITLNIKVAAQDGPLVAGTSVLINPQTRTAKFVHVLKEIYLEKDELVEGHN